MENTHGLRLRRAEKEDCRFLYELRNEEEVRKIHFRQGYFPTRIMWHGLSGS